MRAKGFHGVRNWPLTAAVALMVCCLVLWVATHVLRTPSFSLTLPLPAGREFVLNIWKPEAAFLESDFDHSILHIKEAPLTMMLLYHDMRAVSMTQVAHFEVPSWPLGIAAAVLGCTLAWNRWRVVRAQRAARMLPQPFVFVTAASSEPKSSPQRTSGDDEVLPR